MFLFTKLMGLVFLPWLLFLIFLRFWRSWNKRHGHFWKLASFSKSYSKGLINEKLPWIIKWVIVTITSITIPFERRWKTPRRCRYFSYSLISQKEIRCNKWNKVNSSVLTLQMIHRELGNRTSYITWDNRLASLAWCLMTTERKSKAQA